LWNLLDLTEKLKNVFENKLKIVLFEKQADIEVIIQKIIKRLEFMTSSNLKLTQKFKRFFYEDTLGSIDHQRADIMTTFETDRFFLKVGSS
jgi:hypothetical protein